MIQFVFLSSCMHMYFILIRAVEVLQKKKTQCFLSCFFLDTHTFYYHFLSSAYRMSKDWKEKRICVTFLSLSFNVIIFSISGCVTWGSNMGKIEYHWCFLGHRFLLSLLEANCDLNKKCSILVRSEPHFIQSWMWLSYFVFFWVSYPMGLGNSVLMEYRRC